MEFIHLQQGTGFKIKAAVLDFDGTVSTLRHGWEQIMEPLMLEMIAGSSQIDAMLAKEIREYIDQSAGIQTYHQMKWLAEAVERHGRNPYASKDPWWYKEQYNVRLMVPVNQRIVDIEAGRRTPSDFLVGGSVALLEFFRDQGVGVYVASGTDHADVQREADVLGLRRFFREVAGAPPGKVDCSKEAVLRKLIDENGLKGPEVLVVGDGRVEIALGREVGALTLGVASDEEMLCGINPLKRDRLVKAGAHAIVGDFLLLDEIRNWMGL